MLNGEGDICVDQSLCRYVLFGAELHGFFRQCDLFFLGGGE